MKRLLVVLAFALLPACARADSLNIVANELRDIVDVPFRYNVASLLAGNLLLAQSEASYASAESLQLSIEAVARAIYLDGKSYVGYAATSPGAWIQSTIAIDPNATVVITPSALYFGSVEVTNDRQVPVPEPGVLVVLILGLLVFALTRLNSYSRVRIRA